MPKVIVVDGNIAVGKTTWIDIIMNYLQEKGLKVGVVREPVDEWLRIGILQKFYKNSRKYGYKFQTYVIVSRLQAAINAYKTHGDEVDVYILERSCFTDPIFAQLNHDKGDINTLEYELYKNWASFHYQFMPFQIDGYVYLRCEPEISYHRCLERARDGECNVPLEYLRDLLVLHDKYFLSKKNLFLWDTTQNYIQDLSLKQDMCDSFHKFLEL